MTCPPGSRKWLVVGKGFSHWREDVEAALWLAQSLSRHGWVEVEEWVCEDDPDEGPVWNNQVIWST